MAGSSPLQDSYHFFEIIFSPVLPPYNGSYLLTTDYFGWRYPLLLPLFALTLFVSAMLLFLVQPMIGKMLLPMLGGTPAVWNTCMVFFQALLLAGYAYAHTATAWLGVRRQALLHLGVLLLPCLTLGLTVDPGLLDYGEG